MMQCKCSQGEKPMSTVTNCQFLYSVGGGAKLDFHIWLKNIHKVLLAVLPYKSVLFH